MASHENGTLGEHEYTISPEGLLILNLNSMNINQHQNCIGGSLNFNDFLIIINNQTKSDYQIHLILL